LIREIEYFNEEKMVYSLDVDKNHTYVADGIATHNCIYSFMGSDYRSFDELRKLPNTISLPLSISYRCSKNVVNYAKRFNNNIEAKEGARDGSIVFKADIDSINDGDMVLCRTNAPLLQLYCELTKSGKTAYICGKDVGANLIKVITKTKEEKLNKDLRHKGVFSKLYNNLIDEIDTVMNKHHITLEMAMEDSDVCQMFDTIQALEIISEDMTTSNELVEKIKSLFSDKKMKGISLSTIHKAKGLEAENVFICCPSLLPSKNAKEQWEKEQESNLEYVAYTRAKNNLSFLDESNFKSYSSNPQQRASDISRIMDKVFKLHGGTKRCVLEKPSHEAAKMILLNKTEIVEKPRNTIELGSCGNQPKRNKLNGLVKRRSKRK
jgi:ATP-dependent exoDNAse (exonuclease V) beta subunit